MKSKADELRKAYEVFGADESTPFKTIRKAYYALACRHHPDKNGDQEYFKVINNAFQVIEEHERRRSLKPQCATATHRHNEGKENRPSEARCDTASQRDNGGKRKDRVESTSRTADGRKKNRKQRHLPAEKGLQNPVKKNLGI